VSLQQKTTFLLPHINVATFGLGAIAVLCPLLAIFVHKGIVPLVGLGALIGAIGLARTRRFHVPLPAMVATGLFGLCVYAAITAFWALDATEAFVGALKLFGNFAIGALFLSAAVQLSDENRTQVAHLFVMGWLGGLLTIVIEVLFKGPIFNALLGINYNLYPNGPFWLNVGVTVLIVAYWPASQILRQLWGVGAALLAFFVLLTVTYLIGFNSGVIALCIGALTVAIVRAFGRTAIMVLILIFVVLGFAAPPIMRSFGSPVEAAMKYPDIPAAARHRIAIWAFAAQRIDDHPILGWGMNASKMMPGGKDLLVLSPELELGETLPLHPHNALLQVWLELGIAGFGFYCLIVAGTMLRAARSSLAPFAIGQTTAILTIANLSYGSWQAWWIAAIWFSIAMMAVVPRIQSPTISPER
jgi:O-antigen ligase